MPCHLMGEKEAGLKCIIVDASETSTTYMKVAKDHLEA
jgi:hypothetical protein